MQLMQREDGDEQSCRDSSTAHTKTRAPPLTWEHSWTQPATSVAKPSATAVSRVTVD
jgi:hypothetical protein